MNKTTAQKIFDEIDKIVLNTKENGIPVFENLDLNKEEVIGFDKLNDSGEIDDSNESVIDLDDFDKLNDSDEIDDLNGSAINLDNLGDDYNLKFNKFELENLDLSDSDSNNDIVNSCIEIASNLENLLQNEDSCKQLLNLLNDGKSKEELANLSKEKFQIYERRNWILLQLLFESAMQKKKISKSKLVNFVFMPENYLMHPMVRQNPFGVGGLGKNKYLKTKTVPSIWFLYKIQKVMSKDKDNYISVFNTKREMPNDVCGNLLFEYLEENKQTDNFIKNFSLKLNEIENEIKSSETNDIENNIIFLHDVNKFIKFRENKNRFSYRIFRDKNFSFGETVALQEIFNKCHFWNRRRILRNAMQNNLSDIYDFANKLPSNRRDEFFAWVRNNKGNFNPEFAQNVGFLSCEQEELLQLVPPERQNEFRNLFRNENFRNVCQTPQAVKSLLIIREVCPNFLEYINVDQKMALDTFDIDKIRLILGDKLSQLPPNIESVYLFRFFNKWRSILSYLDSNLSEENKEKLLNCPQLACAKDPLIDQFLLEISDFSQNKGNNYFDYADKIFSKEAIEHFHKNVESELEFEDIETLARNFLGINDNESSNVGSFKNSYMMLATINFEDESYFKPEVLVTLSPNSIANLLNFASQKDNLNFYQGLIKKLDADELHDTKIAVMKSFSKSRQMLCLKFFENKTDFLQFLESAKTVDIFFFINSKKDVLELSELLQVGLDINKISTKDFNAMKLLINNVSDKNLWRKKFVEFSNVNVILFIK